MHVCTVVSERFEGMMCEAATTGGQQSGFTIQKWAGDQEKRESQNYMEADTCLQCCLNHSCFAFAF